jgi:tRNA threonylcarbamoyladenosine biosynthesis protein TsaB
VRVLAWDTATAATAVALLDTVTEDVIVARDDPEPGARPAHATHLLPLADGLLRATGTSWRELDLLAVGVGPGSFTGLRIGLATARGLAQGTGLPLAGVSTLRALAARAEAEPEFAAELVAGVLDARRGEAFAAIWRQGTETLLAPAALAPSALAQRVAELSGRPLAVGGGAVAFRDELEAAGAVIPDDLSPLHRVDAATVARLGAAQGPGEADAVLPDYLRRPDAVPRPRR